MTPYNLAKRILWILALCRTAGCRRAPPVLKPESLLTHTPGSSEPVITVSVPTSTPSRDDGQTEPPTDAAPTHAPQLTPQGPAGGAMTQEQATELAKSELVRHLGSDKDPVSVDKVERVTWSDTSLGCPRKGMMYAQVLTPGYQVILRVGGTQYDVRIGGNRALICQNRSQ